MFYNLENIKVALLKTSRQGEMAETLEPAAADFKQCFVIAPIGDETSETRKRSDQVLKHIIRPAAEECGYRATRADEIDKPGLITSQVIQRVVGDPLVVADLSETNPNVFYELAIRHAIRKPLIQLIEKGQRIPFDVAGTRTIYVDHKDLDSVSGAKADIVAQIRQLEKEPTEIETPISISLDLQILRQSENPEDRSFAELLSEVSNIRTDMAKLHDGVEKSSSEAIQGLTIRVERLVDEIGETPGTRRRNAKYIRHYLPELMKEARVFRSKAIPIAIAASFFRDSAPWLYEIGMEAYRQVSFGTDKKAREALEEFYEMGTTMMRHPLFRDLFGRESEGAGIYVMETLDRVLGDAESLIRRRSRMSE